MKRASLFLIVIALIIAGCSPNEATVADDVKIDLRVEPDPPAAGEAMLYITLTDADGTFIEGATVQVHGDMDHEGMEAVDRESDVTGNNDEYIVPFEWTMGGGWIVAVTATLPNNRGIAQAQFELFVEAISPDSVIHQADGEHGIDMSDDGADRNMDMSNGG